MLDLETVKLVANQLWMNQTLDMTLFVIKGWNLTANIDKGGIRMTIVLKRKIMNEMMTTYLPSVLLILITYATTFFKPYFFEAALSVNLTTMLVMTTIFMTVMQMLPATAYVKMIDIFLIFGQMYPFTEVVLLTVMEYQRDGDGSGMIEEDDIPDESSKKNKNGEKNALYWCNVTGERERVKPFTDYFLFQNKRSSQLLLFCSSAATLLYLFSFTCLISRLTFITSK